jgi:hypothetical protein
MKICIRCKKPKSSDEFYTHPEMADGHLNKCKECCKFEAKKHRRGNRETLREYDHQRNAEPHRVVAKFFYNQSPKGRAASARASRKWWDKNPRKRAAQLLFNNRKRYDLTLATKPCQRCGAVNSHAHHENYDKPLEVVWLCPPHHRERHREMKALGIEP